jgi:trimeric autotransporter adhesin
MRSFRPNLFAGLLLVALQLHGAQYSGSVRAADQPVPGATITARQGETKVTAFTDENGRFQMNLPSGDWDVQVEMFEFTSASEKVSAGIGPISKDWTLEMPRLDQRGGATAQAAAATSAPAATGRRGRGQFRNGGGRGGFPPGRGGAPTQADAAQPQLTRPGFQSAAVRPTQTPAANNAQATLEVGDIGAGSLETGDAEEAFLVNGSTSGGLGAASDDETRRQRAQGGGRGAAGGAGLGFADASLGGGALGLPPGMSETSNDSLGLGGFGASAINGGFGVGAGAEGGGGPGGGGGFGGPGGGGRGGGRGGGGGGRGGGGRGGGRGNQNARRGPYNGQFANFGNRRRTQPPYTGSLSLTEQNSALNAAPFSLNGLASQKPYSSTNNFTATMGGPMVITKLLNWQRANFNFSYRGSLNLNGSNMLGTVPTDAERLGDFSGVKSIIYDPLNGAPFAGNMIPQSRIDQAAQTLLQYFPQPTYDNVVQNYRLITTAPNWSQTIGVRVSAPINNKDRTNFNVQYQDRNSKSKQLFGYTDASDGYGLSASAGWSHSFAPRFNNTATLTFSRNITEGTPFFAYGQNIAAAAGITGTEQDPINYGPPTLSFTNFSGLSDSAASISRNQTINFTDNITYVVRRKHNLTFGFLYRKLQQNSLNYANARGSFSFSGLLTSELNAQGQPVAGTGYDFADFLLGDPQSSSLRFGSANNYFRSWATSWFAQDDWRPLAGLTINVGLRYEYFAPYTELRGHLANLDVSPGFTAVAVVTPGESGPYSGNVPTSLVRSMPNNYSPRIGLAYRPWRKKSLIIRTGYSIFYSGSPYASIASSMAQQPPFAKTASISTNLLDPLTLENGFATSPNQTTNTFGVNPDYKIANAQTWNFTIQNTLPHGWVIETEYIGTKGTNLAITEQPDRVLAGTSVGTQTLQIANTTGFSYLTSGANSIFNAGQARVTRRFTRGISSTILYTFSKSIDNASSFSGTGGTVVQYLDNLGLERGLSTFDQRHNLQMTFLFSSPVGVRGMLRNGGWKTAALAGWTLSGTFAATSGTPLTAYVSGNLANTGGLAAFGNIRAQATGLPVEGGSYFNPAAFTTPVPGEFGDAGRDTIPGLFHLSVNASLNRAFRFGESRRQLQLRINATNVMNHVTVTSVGTTVNSATYGLPTGASGTRTVSVLLRFNF